MSVSYLDDIEDYSTVGYNFATNTLAECNHNVVLSNTYGVEFNSYDESINNKNAIQNAIDSAEYDDIICLPPGHFVIGGSIEINKSGVILKGSTSTTKTSLWFYESNNPTDYHLGVGPSNGIIIGQKSPLYSQPQLVTQAGSDWIETDSSYQVDTDDIVKIEVEITDDFISYYNMEGLTQPEELDGVDETKTWGSGFKKFEIKKVISIDNNRIYFDTPFRIPLSTFGDIQVTTIFNTYKNIGLSNLQLSNAIHYDDGWKKEEPFKNYISSDINLITVKNCINCFVKEIESKTPELISVNSNPGTDGTSSCPPVDSSGDLYGVFTRFVEEIHSLYINYNNFTGTCEGGLEYTLNPWYSPVNEFGFGLNQPQYYCDQWVEENNCSVGFSPSLSLGCSGLWVTGQTPYINCDCVDSTPNILSCDEALFTFDYMIDNYINSGDYSNIENETRHILSNGIKVIDSKNITLSDISLKNPINRGSEKNGILFDIESSNEILISDCKGYRGRHNFNVGGWGTSGVVFNKIHSEGGWSFGIHNEFPLSFFQSYFPPKLSYYSITTGQLTEYSELENTNITEASGLVASRQYSNYFWTHNDDGEGQDNNNSIFAFHRDGNDRGEFFLTGEGMIPQRDWEDMATDNEGNLYIGEIGDNNLAYDTKYVYKCSEPSLSPSGETISCEVFPFQYRLNKYLICTEEHGYIDEDSEFTPFDSWTDESGETFNMTGCEGGIGSTNYDIFVGYDYPIYDAETLMVDPNLNEENKNDIYIVTKSPLESDSSSKLFKLESTADEDGIYGATFMRDIERLSGIGIPQLSKITSGDINRDGDGILLKSYSKIFYYPLRLNSDPPNENQTISEALRGKPIYYICQQADVDAEVEGCDGVDTPNYNNILGYTQDELPYNSQPLEQGEAISWHSGWNGYYTISEAFGAPPEAITDALGIADINNFDTDSDFWSRHLRLELSSIFFGFNGYSQTSKGMSNSILVTDSDIYDGWFSANLDVLYNDQGHTTTNTVFWNIRGNPNPNTNKPWKDMAVPGMSNLVSYQPSSPHSVSSEPYENGGLIVGTENMNVYTETQEGLQDYVEDWLNLTNDYVSRECDNTDRYDCCPGYTPNCNSSSEVNPLVTQCCPISMIGDGTCDNNEISNTNYWDVGECNLHCYEYDGGDCPTDDSPQRGYIPVSNTVFGNFMEMTLSFMTSTLKNLWYDNNIVEMLTTQTVDNVGDFQIPPPREQCGNYYGILIDQIGQVYGAPGGFDEQYCDNLTLGAADALIFGESYESGLCICVGLYDLRIDLPKINVITSSNYDIIISFKIPSVSASVNTYVWQNPGENIDTTVTGTITNMTYNMVFHAVWENGRIINYVKSDTSPGFTIALSDIDINHNAWLTNILLDILVNYMDIDTEIQQTLVDTLNSAFTNEFEKIITNPYILETIDLISYGTLNLTLGPHGTHFGTGAPDKTEFIDYMSSETDDGAFSIQNLYEYQTPLQGDLNQDGNTNIFDIILMIECILGGECPPGADLNQDGIINIIDIVALLNHILSGGAMSNRGQQQLTKQLNRLINSNIPSKSEKQQLQEQMSKLGGRGKDKKCCCPKDAHVCRPNNIISMPPGGCPKDYNEHKCPDNTGQHYDEPLWQQYTTNPDNPVSYIIQENPGIGLNNNNELYDQFSLPGYGEYYNNLFGVDVDEGDEIVFLDCGPNGDCESESEVVGKGIFSYYHTDNPDYPYAFTFPDTICNGRYFEEEYDVSFLDNTADAYKMLVIINLEQGSEYPGMTTGHPMIVKFWDYSRQREYDLYFNRLVDGTWSSVWPIDVLQSQLADGGAGGVGNLNNAQLHTGQFIVPNNHGMNQYDILLSTNKIGTWGTNGTQISILDVQNMIDMIINNQYSNNPQIPTTPPPIEGERHTDWPDNDGFAGGLIKQNEQKIVAGDLDNSGFVNVVDMVAQVQIILNSGQRISTEDEAILRNFIKNNDKRMLKMSVLDNDNISSLSNSELPKKYHEEAIMLMNYIKGNPYDDIRWELPKSCSDCGLDGIGNCGGVCVDGKYKKKKWEFKISWTL